MTTYGGRTVSKLTSQQVIELRETRPETGRTAWYEQQGKRLGVHPVTVANACNGRAWGRAAK